MGAPPEIVEFLPSETSAVVARMDDLLARNRGWLTLQPGVDPEDAPPPRGLFSIFSGRGPAVPVCNWVTGERTGSVTHVSVGVQHASGPKAAKRLDELGAGVPSGWKVLADHPKRGLVVAVPPAAKNSDVLDWLLRAGAALTVVPLTGTWRALVYSG
jgi:hypothetical protein